MQGYCVESLQSEFTYRVSQCWIELGKYAYSILGSEIYEDILQDSLLRAWRRFPEYLQTLAVPFKVWMFGHIKDLSSDYWRGLRKHSEPLDIDQVSDISDSRIEYLSHAEFRLRLCIQLLKQQDRRMLLLFHVAKMSTIEIAARESLTDQAVRSRLTSIRMRLARLFSSTRLAYETVGLLPEPLREHVDLCEFELQK